MAKKYYVIWEGKDQGIFESWEECKALIDGYKGAKYKSFKNYEEAKNAFFQGPEKKEKKTSSSYSDGSNKLHIEELLQKGRVVIFTDGGALGNPGRGGYGAVMLFLKDGKILRKELSEGFRKTTNNRMELLGVIKALENLKSDKAKVEVFSDSKYVVDANTKGWAANWRKKGWIKSNKEEAKNPDLWERLLLLTDRLDVTFHWVKGHAGITENERCDQLAGEVMERDDLPPDEIYENLSSK